MANPLLTQCQLGLALPSMEVTPAGCRSPQGGSGIPGGALRPPLPAVYGLQDRLQAAAAAAAWLLILHDLHILRTPILKHRHRQHLGFLDLER